MPCYLYLLSTSCLAEAGGTPELPLPSLQLLLRMTLSSFD